MTNVHKKDRIAKLNKVFLPIIGKKEVGLLAKTILFDILSQEKNIGFVKYPEIKDKKNLKGAFQSIQGLVIAEEKKLFSEITYQRGKICFTLSRETIYLLGACTQYVLVPKNAFKALRNKHSKTLYLYMLLWRQTGKLFFSLKDRFLFFGRRDGYDFDNYFSEIHRVSRIEAQFKFRGAIQITFSMPSKEPPKTPPKLEKKAEKNFFRVYTQVYKQNTEFMAQLIEKWGTEPLKTLHCSVRHKKDKIKDLRGYVFKCLQNLFPNQLTQMT